MAVCVNELASDASERDLVRISTTDPDSIETREGLSEFVVLKTQISLVG
jgi:hypothetical protein